MRLPHHPQEKAIRNCVGEFFSEFDGPMRLSTVMVSFLSMILIGCWKILSIARLMVCMLSMNVIYVYKPLYFDIDWHSFATKFPASVP